MRVVIADDEAPARCRLRGLIGEVDPNVVVVGEASNGREVLAMLESVRPDLVLLDIRMPTLDGMDTALALASRKESVAVIFTTAFDEHALEAFEANAVDYLLKPIRKERLQTALTKAAAYLQGKRPPLSGHEMGPDGAGRSHICTQLGGQLRIIPLADVRYFRAEQKYVNVGTGGREILVSDALKSLEKEFSDKLLRVHRNALVVRSCIEGLERDQKGTSFVRLRDVAMRIEVSRRHLPAVRSAVKKFV